MKLTTSTTGRSGGVDLNQSGRMQTIRGNEIGFWARIVENPTSAPTSCTGTGSAGVPYSWVEVQALGNGTFLDIPGGRRGTVSLCDSDGDLSGYNVGYEVNEMPTPIGAVVWMWQGVSGEFLFAFGGSDGQWVRLVDKLENDPPVYAWRAVRENIVEALTRLGTGTTGTGSCISGIIEAWTYTGDKGDFCPNHNPAFSVNQVNLPVEKHGIDTGTGTEPNPAFASEAIVRLYKGNGNWSFFEQSPRFEIVVKTSAAFPIVDTATGQTHLYHSGFIARYDQVTKQMCRKEVCLLRSAKCVNIDANGCCTETST